MKLIFWYNGVAVNFIKSKNATIPQLFNYSIPESQTLLIPHQLKSIFLQFLILPLLNPQPANFSIAQAQ